MFYLNVGYQWSLATQLDNINNVILLPSGIDKRKMSTFPRSNFQHVLIDPQLYLADLAADDALNACFRLATYGWFGVDNIPEYAPEQFGGIREWESEAKEAITQNWSGNVPDETQAESCCEECLNVQLDLSCSQLILPTPLLNNRDDDAELYSSWLDKGINVANSLEVGSPILASISIDESELNDQAFDSGGFLENITGQVMAREEIGGVYIVILQTHARHPFEINDLAVRAYMFLCNAFKEVYDTIIVNFADIVGLACLGKGATSVASGESFSKRRISHENFKDSGGGLALPHLYSHNTITEYLSERDLDDIKDNRRLLRLVTDITPYSRNLFRALRNGNSASSLAQWAESRNNVQYANKHYVTRFLTESNRLSTLSDPEKADSIMSWLQNAEIYQGFIRDVLGRDIYKKAPVSNWIDFFENGDLG